MQAGLDCRPTPLTLTVVVASAEGLGLATPPLKGLAPRLAGAVTVSLVGVAWGVGGG